MIEIIGYLAIYLSIGWILYPITISLKRAYGERARGFTKIVDISIWPIMLIVVTFIFILLDGYFNFHKWDNND